MMTGRFKGIGILLGLLTITNGTGCIVIGVSWSSPSQWTEKESVRFTLETAGLEGLNVRTHNGHIKYQVAGPGEESYVTVTRQAGGRSAADAQTALDALEVYVEPDENDPGLTKIGWRWNATRQPSWRARVSFDITGPSRVKLSATTHNGAIAAHGIEGSIVAVTHNGSIKVSGTGEKLRARTHNGGVIADYAGKEVSLSTHNGSIKADLSRCGTIHGQIRTHNGSVEVIVGDKVSARFDVQTHNGAIRCNLPGPTQLTTSRHHVRATLGDGDGDLSIQTHNGGVRVRSLQGQGDS